MYLQDKNHSIKNITLVSVDQLSRNDSPSDVGIAKNIKESKSILVLSLFCEYGLLRTQQC